MKKLFITLMMMLCLSVSANAYSEVENHEISSCVIGEVNTNSLARYLDITKEDAYYLVNVLRISDINIQEAINSDNGIDAQKKKVNRALNYAVAQGYAFLDHERYRKYLLVLNTTLVNRDLIKYI